MQNCLFADNSASKAGGALIAADGVDYMEVSGTYFCGNSPEPIDGGWTDQGGNTFYGVWCDHDGDDVPDYDDNCALNNPDQADCNGDGIGDICNISDGTSEDINSNDIPGECECLIDVVVDGEININDLLVVIATWGTTGPMGDVNYDGIVDTNDILLVLSAWGPCP